MRVVAPEQVACQPASSIEQPQARYSWIRRTMSHPAITLTAGVLEDLGLVPETSQFLSPGESAPGSVCAS